MLTTSNTAKTFYPFLDLPAEIRNAIYKELFRTTEVRWMRKEYLITKPAPEYRGIGLLMASKQLRSEALPIYHGYTTFHVNSECTMLGACYTCWQLVHECKCTQFLQQTGTDHVLARMEQAAVKFGPVRFFASIDSEDDTIRILKSADQAQVLKLDALRREKLRHSSHGLPTPPDLQTLKEVRVLGPKRGLSMSDILSAMPPGCEAPIMLRPTPRTAKATDLPMYNLRFTLMSEMGVFDNRQHFVFTNVVFNGKKRILQFDEIDHIPTCWSTDQTAFSEDILLATRGRCVATNPKREFLTYRRGGGRRNYLTDEEKQILVASFRDSPTWRGVQIKWKNVLQGPTVFLNELRKGLKYQKRKARHDESPSRSVRPSKQPKTIQDK